ncbi:MAG: carboxypeptidase regulatory-like domain-containing protein [Acidobacteria bacterium]|nr:carboxypeptidase regulatory-like domain-containing protein [Acidobacteriota bacterium]
MRTYLRIPVACLLVTGGLWAQADRAAVNGTVRDASGLVVPEAKVEALNPADGLRREIKTDSTGTYQLVRLPIGTYTVTISKEGFKTAKIDGVQLSVGQVRTLDAQLETGTVATQLEVTAETAVVDRSTSEIGTAIGETQIRNIPVNGRNWTALMLLAPGATNTGEGNQNSIRFFGRPRDENNWTFDGVDATGVKDPRQETSLRLVISLDSIAEFRVSSSMYTAEGGGGGGGLVNLVSKTGTNEFHGSTFWFVRNSYFDARRFIDGPVLPPVRLNQYGANFGGPIAKNKLFFFANYEGLRQRLTTTSASGLVPSQAYRAATSASTPALRPILEAFPVGNAGAVNANVDRYVGTPRQIWNEDSGMFRIDYRINDRHSLFARYNSNTGFISEPRTALLETRDSDIRPVQGTIQWQSVFGVATVNELRVGVNRSALERTQVGRYRYQISVPGFTGTQAGRDEVEKPTSYSVLDNFSRIFGRHTFKAGFESRRVDVNVADSGASTLTYGTLANFTANRMDSLARSTNYPMLGARRYYTFFYAQDEFKMRPNLTVNYGVRYENYGLANEVHNRGKVLDFDRCGGLCPANTPWYFRDNNNFAPRVSLAWSPEMFKGRTVFRAGAGMYHTPGQNDDVNAALDSFGESYTLTIAEQAGLSFPVDSFLNQARTSAVTPRALQRDRRDAYTTNWTFSMQHQLPASFVLQAAYVGNKGTHLFGRDRLNNIDPVTGRRPYAGFSSIDRKVNYNRNSFNGLQASLNRSLKRGFMFQMQYLYGKVVDDNAGSGEGAEVMRSNCRSCDRARADFDIRQTMTANAVYELPWGKKRLWGGWAVSGFYFVRTGRPVNILVNRAQGTLPDGNTVNQRPNYAGGAVVLTDPNPGAYLNRAAFAIPAAGTWGNLGRNVGQGPGLWQVDTALTKRTRITEQFNLEFRAETFNLFNRAQYGNPVNNFSNGTFGTILTTANDGVTGQGTPRQFQFALRLNF